MYNNGGYNNNNKGGYGYNRGYGNTQGAGTGAKEGNRDNQKKSNESVGAIWIRRSQSGLEYFSISINGESYVAFRNDYKNSDKQPDFKIFKTEQRDTTVNNNTAAATGGYSGSVKQNGYGATPKTSGGYGARQSTGGYYKNAQNTGVVEGESAVNAYYEAYEAQNNQMQKQNGFETVEDIGAIPEEDFPVL